MPNTTPTFVKKHAERKYRERLRAIPAAGHGAGCHVALLGVANLGVRAEVPNEQIFADIRAHIPPGTRAVPDSEIWDAVRTARSDAGGFTRSRPPKQARRRQRPILDGPRARERIIKRGQELADLELRGNTLPPDTNPAEDMALLLQTLYTQTEFLFIGGRRDGRLNVRLVPEWLAFFAKPENRNGARFPHVIPNPLTGQPAPVKAGNKQTWRGDNCVADFRYAVAEFDTISKEEQLLFWRGFGLPLVALIDSGGKSLHAWIRVDARNVEEWDELVENAIYADILVPLGCDPACRNESRLSRLPGVERSGKGTMQKLLYLNPAGGAP